MVRGVKSTATDMEERLKRIKNVHALPWTLTFICEHSQVEELAAQG